MELRYLLEPRVVSVGLDLTSRHLCRSKSLPAPPPELFHDLPGPPQEQCDVVQLVVAEPLRVRSYLPEAPPKLLESLPKEPHQLLRKATEHCDVKRCKEPQQWPEPFPKHQPLLHEPTDALLHRLPQLRPCRSRGPLDHFERPELLRPRSRQFKAVPTLVLPSLTVQLGLRLPQPRRLLELKRDDPLSKLLRRHKAVVRPYHLRLGPPLLERVAARLGEALRLWPLESPLPHSEKPRVVEVTAVPNPCKMPDKDPPHLLHLAPKD